MKSETVRGLAGLAVAVTLLPASAGAQIPARSFKKHQVLPKAPEIVATDAPGRKASERIANTAVSPSDLTDALLRKAARPGPARSATIRKSSPARIASSFGELSAQELRVDAVYVVTTCTGPTTRGMIAALSPLSLTLRVDSGLHRLSEDEVCLIERRRADSLWNGVSDGASIGFVGGLFTGAAVCHCAEGAVAMGLGGVALGAALGTGIDATTQDGVIIYRKTGSSFTARQSPL